VSDTAQVELKSERGYVSAAGYCSGVSPAPPPPLVGVVPPAPALPDAMEEAAAGLSVPRAEESVAVVAAAVAAVAVAVAGAVAAAAVAAAEAAWDGPPVGRRLTGVTSLSPGAYTRSRQSST